MLNVKVKKLSREIDRAWDDYRKAVEGADKFGKKLQKAGCYTDEYIQMVVVERKDMAFADLRRRLNEIENCA